MSDIFLSYASADRDFVARLVPVLEAQGWSVWWDRQIVAGQDWESVIERVLDKSRCVVVVWSKSSVDSAWVRIEAGLGRERAKIAPVLMEDVSIPIAFRQIQTASLAGWDGSASFAPLHRLQDGIRRILEGPVATTQTNPIAPISHERALDAALPKEMAVNSSINLVAMIRRTDSPGLRGILADDDEYDLTPKDVVSKAVTITHPVDGRGRPLPADILIRVISPGFDPAMQEKRIQVSPQRDSTVCAFLLRALETGGLIVQLDLYQRDTCVASRIIRANGIPVGQVSTTAAHNVVSLPLNVNVVERETTALPMAASPVLAETMQMRIPESVSAAPPPMPRAAVPPPPLPQARPAAPAQSSMTDAAMPTSASPLPAATTSKGFSGSAWAKLGVAALVVVLGVPVLLMQMQRRSTSAGYPEGSMAPPPAVESTRPPIDAAPPKTAPTTAMPTPPPTSPSIDSQAPPVDIEPAPSMPAPAPVATASPVKPAFAADRRLFDVRTRVVKVKQQLNELIERQKVLPRGEILAAEIEMDKHLKLAGDALDSGNAATAIEELNTTELSLAYLERSLR